MRSVRGYGLAPNALQVMEWLGILGKLQAAGNTIDRITLAKADLSPLSDNDQKPLEHTFGYTTIAIHRAQLQRILFDQIPKEKIEFGKALDRFETSETGSIQLHFEDGSTFNTDFLIGADGIHSKIRKQLFPQSKTRFSGQTCWRGIASYALAEDFAHRGMELWGNRVRFGISQISEGKVYWFAVVCSKNDPVTGFHPIKEKLRDLFSDFHPLVNQLIDHTEPSKILQNDIWDLHPLSQWYKGKICLLGDAGHATTPNMGQGAAQAIEDAYFLALSIKNNASEKVFPAFQKRRYKKVNTIVKQSWQIGQMAHWRFGQSFRNLLLKSIPRSFTKRKMMEVYHLNQLH